MFFSLRVGPPNGDGSSCIEKTLIEVQFPKESRNQIILPEPICVLAKETTQLPCTSFTTYLVDTTPGLKDKGLKWPTTWLPPT